MANQKRPLSPKQLAVLERNKFRAGGPSPNPNGRPKSLTELIRAETKNGAEVVQVAAALMRDAKLSPKVRLESLSFLAERGWGKAPNIELAGPLPEDAATGGLPEGAISDLLEAIRGGGDDSEPAPNFALVDGGGS